ncbi:MAG TPA: FtsX-like permease family protein [Streptosporangiaceae bacterium]|nr:FtsX-like permease family protein [Streptosporangiaceae bacterium]
MGRILLIGRLAARDLRHRPAQAALLLLAVTAATAVLALGLALHGVTSQPYQQTRAATRGPDVVAQLGGPYQGPHGPAHPGTWPQVLTDVRTLVHAPGVTGHSGPYPVASALLRVRGMTVAVEAEGRDQAPASVDQPQLTAGSWVRSGGVVIERTFADALGVGVGDRVTLNGRPFTVAGIAVTAASPPYPNMCYYLGGGCVFDLPGQSSPGLAWVTKADARSLASAAAPLSYFLNLRLSHPAAAQAFASHTYPAANLIPWQGIAAADGLLVLDEQQVLSPGALLAALLAMASVAVLAGGRMAEHTRRIGLLKAAGATPGLVTVVLLAENVVLALAAAAIALAVGWLAAPLITNPGAGLVGAPGAPALTLSIAEEVIAVALAAALAGAVVPAIRAAGTSTVSALTDRVRRPRRGAVLIAVSRRLPVPLLLGMRLVARRPGRALLSGASIAVTATGIVAVLAFHTTVNLISAGAAHGLGNPVVTRDEQMLQVLTVVLVALAVLNAVVTAWATVQDTRHTSALARALGASPHQIGAAISAAQLIPALPGALLGIPLGIGLFAVASHTGMLTIPSAWWLAAAVLGTLAAVDLLASVTARIGSRHPPGEILQAESP